MRVTLPNLQQIEGFYQPLADTLRRLVAAIQTGWNKQHQGDGSHTAVTATSLEVSGATVLGKLNLRSVTYEEPTGTGGTVNNLSVAGLVDVSVLRILGETSPLQITGIDATGRSRGDLLLVLNCDYTLDPQDLQLLGENTGSVAANRFAETTAFGGPGSTYVIQGARGVWLMYDYQEQEVNSNPLGGRWRIIADA